MTATNSNANSAERKFFDLHTDGVGYLNRIRQVKPNRGKPFLACDISALVGPADAVEYRRFDCRVTGADAQHLIQRCQQAVDEGKKVLTGFRLGDLWTRVFTYSNGPKEGQTGVSLKARLLLVRWIKVDGQTVYTTAPRLDSEASNEVSGTPVPPESPPESTTPPTASPSQPATPAAFA